MNNLNFNVFFDFSTCKITGANHKYKINMKSTEYDTLKYSFSVRIVREWNCLSGSVVLWRPKIREPFVELAELASFLDSSFASSLSPQWLEYE